MAYSTDRFKNAKNGHDATATPVPAGGGAVKVGPHGNVFVGTHSFIDVTSYDLELQIDDGSNHWMNVPYAYIKNGNASEPGVIRAEKLPVGASVRVNVPRIDGNESVLSVTVLTDDFQ